MTYGRDKDGQAGRVECEGVGSVGKQIGKMSPLRQNRTATPSRVHGFEVHAEHQLWSFRQAVQINDRWHRESNPVSTDGANVVYHLSVLEFLKAHVMKISHEMMGCSSF